MAPKVDVVQYIIKTAAVSGIALFWVNLTLKSFKMAWHIMSSHPEEETWEPVVKQRVMCEECQEYFFDDGNKLKHKNFCVRFVKMSIKKKILKIYQTCLTAVVTPFFVP